MNLNLLSHFRLPVTVAALSLCINLGMAQTASTTVTEWQYGKNGAVSITYDDASRNQFTRALPVMERLKIPATFFVITGPITGSKYQGKFLGRPVEVIIKESATIPTNDNNFWNDVQQRGISAIGDHFISYPGRRPVFIRQKTTGLSFDG